MRTPALRGRSSAPRRARRAGRRGRRAGLVVGAVEDDVRASSARRSRGQDDGVPSLRLPRGAGHELLDAPARRGRPTTSCGRSSTSARRPTRNGVRLYVTVMHPGSATTPLTDEARADVRRLRRGDRPEHARLSTSSSATSRTSTASGSRSSRSTARALRRATTSRCSRSIRRAEGCVARRARLRRRRLPARKRPARRRCARPTRRRSSSRTSASRTERADATDPSWTRSSSTCTATTRVSRRRPRIPSTRRSASLTTTKLVGAPR